MILALAVVGLVALTGPDRQTIFVNPSEVVSVRAPRVSDHFVRGTRCLLNTADGKLLTVVEDCATVRARLAAP